eukprot:281736-Pleurochrysis_carterae.AAC.2
MGQEKGWLWMGKQRAGATKVQETSCIATTTAKLTCAVSHLVVGERDSLAVDLSVPTLVDEVPYGLQVGVTVHDVGVDLNEHIHGGLVDAHEDAVVDLQQPQHLHDVPHLGLHAVDTTQPHHEEQLLLRRHMEGACGRTNAS